MNKSDSIKELAGALAKAQSKIKGALKDSANPFFKSKYADLASVVEAIRGALSENGLAYVQLTIPSDKEEVQVETILMHSSGEWISGIIALPVSKADAQGFGSALTYARRYGLSAMVGVAPEDDDGNAAAAAKPTNDPGAVLARRVIKANITPTADAADNVSPEQRKRMREIAETCIHWMQKDSVADAAAVADETEMTAEEGNGRRASVMAFQQKDLSGALFKNDKRTEENNQPNAKGDCLIDGVAYWVSAWTKKDKNGNPWQSLSFQRKE